jgi:hypothetical protein
VRLARWLVVSCVLMLVAVAACSSGGGGSASRSMRSSDPSTSATTLASTTTTVLEGEVTVSRDVQYGENRSYGNDPIALRMDVFVPGRAAEGGWPLLVLLGRATPDPTNVTPGPPDPDISNPAKYGSDFATTIAERGIVVATIDSDQELRASGEGTQIPADTGVAWRTLRAIQDTKAAVRFFRGDAATSDRYGIDPERVFIGGHSVMGTLSGITTYLDEPAAWGPDMEKVAAAYGGLEGSAGSPNYDSSVSAWISLAGALPADDLHWITPDDVPMLVVYPTHDETMPTNRKTMTMLGFTAEWAGGTTLYAQATAAHLTQSQIYAIEGGDHYSAEDPSTPGLIPQITTFITSLY